MRKKNTLLRLFSILLAAALALVFPACADQPDARQAVKDAFAALQAEAAADPVRVAEVTPVRTKIDIGYYDEDDGPVYLDVCVMKYGSHQMKYTMDIIGNPDADGTYPLYIALHGGGGAPEESNNEQWLQMTDYYKGAVSNGIYVACRGIEDVWNTHFVDDSYPLYDRLIENMILLKHADPNRVYLLGFSAGGDGVFAVAPRMADRFAAVNMSSGHPNGVSLLNAANLPFEIQVGIRDYYSEDAMRSIRAAEFEKTLTDYSLQYGCSYPHRVLVHVPAGHNYLDSEDGAQTVVKDPAEFARRAAEENWLDKFLSVLARIDGSDDVSILSYTSGDPELDEAMSALVTETLGLEVTPSVNTNAVAYVSSFTRNPVPEKLVWDLSTRAPARQYTGFYWLRADYSVNRGILTASFDKASNTVSVTISEDVNGDFDILLNPLLVDFSRLLTVQTPKGEWTFTPEADPALIRQSLEASGDPNLAYAALVRVGADGTPRP